MASVAQTKRNKFAIKHSITYQLAHLINTESSSIHLLSYVSGCVWMVGQSQDSQA